MSLCGFRKTFWLNQQILFVAGVNYVSVIINCVSCTFLDKLFMTDIPIRDLENNKNTTKIKEDIGTVLKQLKTENVPGMEMYPSLLLNF